MGAPLSLPMPMVKILIPYYAAGYLLALESGGFSETIEGEVVYNGTLSPRSVIAASNAQLFAQWADWIRQS